MTGDVMTVSLTDEAFEDCVKQAIIHHLAWSKEFQDYLTEAVREEVKIQAPGNPRIAKVIRKVQEQLDRYPAIADDKGLQDAVGKAIFDYLQGTL